MLPVGNTPRKRSLNTLTQPSSLLVHARSVTARSTLPSFIQLLMTSGDSDTTLTRTWGYSARKRAIVSGSHRWDTVSTAAMRSVLFCAYLQLRMAASSES